MSSAKYRYLNRSVCVCVNSSRNVRTDCVLLFEIIVNLVQLHHTVGSLENSFGDDFQIGLIGFLRCLVLLIQAMDNVEHVRKHRTSSYQSDFLCYANPLRQIQCRQRDLRRRCPNRGKHVCPCLLDNRNVPVDNILNVNRETCSSLNCLMRG